MYNFFSKIVFQIFLGTKSLISFLFLILSLISEEEASIKGAFIQLILG